MLVVVACIGVQPFKDHQYGRALTVCPRLAKCFDVIESILANRPRRQFAVRRGSFGRVLVASDAALEGPRCDSGGFLILWHPAPVRTREAFLAVLQADLYLLARRARDCSVDLS